VSGALAGRPLFIAFEGGEGAGKTTQARLLQQRLLDSGRNVVLTREPGGTRLGEGLRDIILHSANGKGGSSLVAAAELFLFLAARAQLVEEVIRPALADGKAVVCDRFSASTIAYQGYGRGLELGAVRRACELATGGLQPDLSILLDMPVDAGLRRQAESGESADRIGGETREFHERVRRGFREIAAGEPGRWLVVDASRSVEEVAQAVWEKVRELL